MRRKKLFKTILLPFFFIILSIFISNQFLITTKAAGQDTTIQYLKQINDGVDDWTYYTGKAKNKIGEIPIGDGLSLGYTFGTAQDANGKVISGQDDSITTDNVITSGLQTNSKINIFLNRNGYYYGVVHQNKDAYIGGKPETASDTSLDFAYVNGISSISGSTYGIMAKLKDKVYATSTDSNGLLVMKIGGLVSNQTGLYAEVLLRPSPSGAPIVQRELYLYNTSSLKTKFQVYFGEDTALGKDPTVVDDVPLYAIGNNEGLYIYDSKNPANSEAKLYVTNNVSDGFTSFMGKVYMDSAHWDSKGYAQGQSSGIIVDPNLKYYGSNASLDGDNGRDPGSKLLFGQKQGSSTTYPVTTINGSQDSAYTLRWNPIERMEVGDIAHFSSTMGATLAGYPIPSVSKKYTNTTPHSDGLNHIGDKLKFTLTAQNDGLKSNWSLKEIKDALPTGLTIDPNSIEYKWTEMTTSGSEQNQEDTEKTIASGSVNPIYVNGNTLDYTPANTILKEKDHYYVTFYATVNNKAPSNVDSSKNLTNTASFTGFNADTNKDNKTYSDSVKIPIDVSGFNYSFSNQVRNTTTDPGGNFSGSVDAHKGDIVEFKSIFSGTQEIQNGAIYKNILDNSQLSLVSGSVTLNGQMQPDSISGSGIFFPKTAANKTNIVTFKATVNSSTKDTIKNTATMVSLKTSSDDTYNNLISDEAVVNVQEDIPSTAFIEVPQFIDFGSINSTGNERMLTNKQTKGNLIVSHNADTPFQVLVSYDNDSDHALNNGSEKLIQDNGLSLLFNNNANESQDDWTPLSSTGIPIANKDFSGSNDTLDLTQYVGLNKWKLRVPGTAKSGKYTGQVTWTIADTPI